MVYSYCYTKTSPHLLCIDLKNFRPQLQEQQNSRAFKVFCQSDLVNCLQFCLFPYIFLPFRFCVFLSCLPCLSRLDVTDLLSPATLPLIHACSSFTWSFTTFSHCSIYTWLHPSLFKFILVTSVVTIEPALGNSFGHWLFVCLPWCLLFALTSSPATIRLLFVSSPIISLTPCITNARIPITIIDINLLRFDHFSLIYVLLPAG